MSYWVDIIDTQSTTTSLVYEQAAKSSIVLEWNGSDAKDEQTIVGSSLKFRMLSHNDDDGAFAELFTCDETRFKVEIKKSSDNAVLWQGFILPERYSEPYKQVNFFVSFEATDGLGRLKGKYLPDDFYSEEKSVIQIISTILSLTGLQLNLFFAPAIENAIEKDYNLIYINTEDFIDKKKKLDAYKILDTLLKDMLCVCYQADNAWYVEGLNQRQFRIVTFKKYSYLGVYDSDVTVTKLLKTITALATPTVTITPPYNKIEVTHEREVPVLPAQIQKEKNDGWAIVTGVDPEVISTDWIGHNNFYMTADKNILNLERRSLNNVFGSSASVLNYVSLATKIYLNEGYKIRLKISVGLVGEGALPDGTDLLNPFKYKIVVGNSVILSNDYSLSGAHKDFKYTSNRDDKIEYDFIVQTAGLLDIQFYSNTNGLDLELLELDFEVLDFEDTIVVNDIASLDFSLDKDYELDYCDDASGFSKAFRLKKLKNKTVYYNEFEIPILYGFQQDGLNYSVIQLKGANLIDENLTEVYYDDVKISVTEVIYNYNKGEQMVIKTPIYYPTGSFVVRKYAVDDVVEDRVYWEQWTDSVYKIERVRYAKCVANIFRRMFNDAHEKIEFVLINSVKFNDILKFKYVLERNFLITNCSWDLDKNETTIVASRLLYKDYVTNTDNIPPIVVACDDIFMTNTQTEVDLTATAYDPDGFIVSQLWQKTIGPSGNTIVTPNLLNTQVTGLTGNFYEFKILVTDNDGATAYDTVNVIREVDYVFSLDLVEETIDSNVLHPSILRKYKLNITPTLEAGYIVKLDGFFQLSVLINGSFGVSADAYWQIEKNGVIIDGVNAPVSNDSITLNYISTDLTYIYLSVSAVAGDSGSGDNAQSYASVTISSAEIITGYGTVTGVPITKDQEVNVSS